MVTTAQLASTILQILHAEDGPLHEKRIRDRACVVFPSQLNLLMVREALKHLLGKQLVREFPGSVWGLQEKASPTDSGRPPDHAQVAPSPATIPSQPQVAAKPPRTSDQKSVPLTQSDPSQAEVIRAPSTTRQVIEAGPGCGKTYVACARVAHLLDAGEVPDRLLLLSFTRTAVHEMRNRIAQMASAGANTVRGVEIRTVDAFAWRITAGSQELAGVGSYEESIQAAHSALLHPDEELRSYLNRFNHVLVDEAQDLVGPRAALILQFLNSLRNEAGWTIFLDPAQAIYGWSSDAGEHGSSAAFPSLIDQLQGNVQHKRLTRVYRTSDRELLELMSRTRALALEAPSGQRLECLHAELEGKADREPLNSGDIVPLVKNLGPEAGQSLILFRWRVDTLMAASYLTDAGIPYRLRLGGLPRVATPWIAMVANQLALAGARLSGITREDFNRAWAIACAGRFLASAWTPDAAWDLLRRIGPSGKLYVDFKRIADRLAVSVLPDDAFVKDIGPGGPILGTVHGSKGREARNVLFCLPPKGREYESNAESDEEARVLYVAASRAIHKLQVLRGGQPSSFYFEHRPWRFATNGIKVEIGREGDVDTTWPLCMEHGEEAAVQQLNLAAFDGHVRRAHVQTEGRHDKTGTRRIVQDDDRSILLGTLSKGCINDLAEIIRRSTSKGFHPSHISHLSWIDVSTAAVREDHRHVSALPFPWKETRLLLTPVIAGMGYIYAKK